MYVWLKKGMIHFESSAFGFEEGILVVCQIIQGVIAGFKYREAKQPTQQINMLF